MTMTTRIIRHGVVAGILGAVTVALWFLLFDALRGQPLETPTLLASVLLHGTPGGELPTVSWSLVLQYSIVHLSAFVLFGVTAAALIVAAEREPSLLIALLIFFAGFEVFFIALIMFYGPALLTVISWWSILAGNLLASGVMLAYFFFRHRALGQTLLGPWAIRVIGEGIAGGLIGAVTVAGWFFIYDLMMNRPVLYTPTVLGAALLEEVHDLSALQVSVNVVLGYTVLHGAAFILFGIVTALMLAFSEREPLLLLGVFLLFICFEVFFFSFAMLVDEALLQALYWWAIFVANILATMTMLSYFLGAAPPTRKSPPAALGESRMKKW